MRYLSVCSGIEAASVAWHHLDWTPAAFSEVAPFPSSVLKHRYPHVENLGDFTRITRDTALQQDLGDVHLLVGGTPCQSFSVAGLRGGLSDERGNLALEFCRLAAVLRPRWVLWENVPGVLSSNGGRDFGAILGALGELGYGWAYRVLDAQYFGVAQKRRRVFIVGHLGDAGRAGEVLLEPESLCGVPSSRPGKGKAARKTAGGDATPCSVHPDCQSWVKDTCGTLSDGAHMGGGLNGQDAVSGRILVDCQGRVRRLTPLECERLQGFPDDWTSVPGAKDGPRFRAIGNTMAVPVMRWIGERIAAVEAA